MNEKNFSVLEKMILDYFKESQQNHVPFIDRSTGLNEYVVVADKPRTEERGGSHERRTAQSGRLGREESGTCPAQPSVNR